MGFKQTLFLSFIFIVFSTFSCKRDILGEKKDISHESFEIDQQIKIGDKISEAIFNNPAEFPILDKDDPLYQNAYNYLQNDILDVIVKSPAMTKWKDFNWKVNIVDLDKDYHAFFLPNGEFFIYVDLLKLLENDAELLGIVAHELAYIEKNLVVKNLKAKFGNDVLSDLLADKQVNGLTNMALLEYESNEVLYADSFAVAAICPFSYDSKEFQKVLEHFDTGFPDSVNIDWYTRKNSAEYVDRKNKIEDFFREHAECRGSGGVTRTEEYEQFVNLLPQ